MVPSSARPYQGSAKIVRPSPAGTMQAARSTASFSSGSVMWVPRLGAIRGTSVSSRISFGRRRSAQTPVAFTTLSAWTSNFSPDSVSRTHTPSAFPSRSSRSTTSAPFRQTAPKRSASPSTVSTSRTSSVWQSKKRYADRGSRCASAGTSSSSSSGGIVRWRLGAQ